MPGRLHVVSTPIGNLDDITLRALQTLKSVALIAAEDTRRTGRLLRHFGITTPTTSLHEHNERQKLPSLLQKLSEGADVALVSDAGTPVVSDPGQRLIAASIEKGIRVVPIPGPARCWRHWSLQGFPPMLLSLLALPHLGLMIENSGCPRMPMKPSRSFFLSRRTVFLPHYPR